MINCMLTIPYITADQPNGCTDPNLFYLPQSSTLTLGADIQTITGTRTKHSQLHHAFSSSSALFQVNYPVNTPKKKKKTTCRNYTQWHSFFLDSSSKEFECSQLGRKTIANWCSNCNQLQSQVYAVAFPSTDTHHETPCKALSLIIYEALQPTAHHEMAFIVPTPSATHQLACVAGKTVIQARRPPAPPSYTRRVVLAEQWLQWRQKPHKTKNETSHVSTNPQTKKVLAVPTGLSLWVSSCLGCSLTSPNAVVLLFHVLVLIFFFFWH